MAQFVSIQADVKAVVANLGSIAQKQVPFATAKALTALAFEVQAAERIHMRSVFRNPRPFTQRATMVTKATKANPVATVYLRPEADRYLAPYETGGTHALPGGGLLNPKDVRLDQYGQMRRGLVQQLLGQPDVFAATITFKKSGQTVTGIWRRPPSGEQRQGGRGTKGRHQNVGGVRTGLDLLIRLGNALPVQPILGFVDTAQALISRRARPVFDAELAKAISTART